MGSASMDAGEGNEFRNARTSCIAGPCPFTKIEDEDFAQNGRTINVSARNWSDLHGQLSASLKSQLDDLGQQHLANGIPNQSYTTSEALASLSWLVGRHIPLATG